MNVCTPAGIIPCDHRNDTHAPIALIRALSGPDATPPVTVEFITLADVSDRVEWV